MGIESISNHADYRLLSRRALDALAKFKEVNLFIRGVVPLIGFKSCSVYYSRGERFAGESKYPTKEDGSFFLHLRIGDLPQFFQFGFPTLGNLFNGWPWGLSLILFLIFFFFNWIHFTLEISFNWEGRGY